MKRILLAVVLLLSLTSCGGEPPKVPTTFKDKPIDCVQTGEPGGPDYALTCDFVGWHQRWDPKPSATPSPRADRSGPLITPKPKPTIAPSMRPRSVRPASGLNWAALRRCESNGSGGYKANTGNGYYGAYQFDLRTWRGLGYSGYPHQASPATQDAAARKLYSQRGRQPWPTCGRLL